MDKDATENWQGWEINTYHRRHKFYRGVKKKEQKLPP